MTDEMVPKTEVDALVAAEVALFVKQVIRDFEQIRHQERIRISGTYSVEFAGKDVDPKDVAQYHNQVTDTFANAIEIVRLALANPSALAEHDAALRAQLEASEALFRRETLHTSKLLQLLERIDRLLADDHWNGKHPKECKWCLIRQEIKEAHMSEVIP